MKTLTLLLLLFFTSTNTQPLEFKDIIFSYENNLDRVTQLMSEKDFYFEETTVENDEKGMVWKYKPTIDFESTLYFAKFCLKEKCGGIHIQTDIKDFYFNLKRQAIEYGFEYDRAEKSNYKDDDAISFFYYFDDYVLILSEGKSKYGKNNFTITLR